MSITRRMAALATASVLALGIAVVPAATATAAPQVSITTTSIPAFTVGTPVSFQLTASDATAKWSAIALPAGLSISTSGVLSGTPSAVGINSYSTFTARVGGIFEFNLDIETLPITIKPVAVDGNLPAATVGAAYSHSIAAAPGLAERRVLNGSLPAGISFSSYTGTFSGTPSGSDLAASDNSRSYTGTISYEQYKLGGGWTALDSTAYSITVRQPAPVVTATALPAATLGVPYSAFVSATGAGTIVYSSSALPAGLSLNATTGEISGIPVYSAAYTAPANTVPFDVVATNAIASAPLAHAIVVNVPAPTIEARTLPNATVGAAYSQQIATAGPDGAPRVTTVTAGALPAGLTLSQSGLLSGTPSYDASYGKRFDASFTVTVTGPGGVAAQSYDLRTIVPKGTLVTSALAEGWLDNGYTQAIVTAGPVDEVVVRGLPRGLSFDGAVISGTPERAGEFAVTLRVKNSAGTSSSELTLVVQPKPVFTTESLPPAVVGTAYEQDVAASGKNVTFSLGNGAPTGMTITADGHISWMPTDAGSFDVKVKAVNPSGQRVETFTITVYIAPTITSTSVAPGTQGRVYMGAIDTTGADVALSLTGGSLPMGLSLNADGSLQGTPTQSGTFTFEVTATNPAGSVTAEFSITIAAPAVTPSVTQSATPLIVPARSQNTPPAPAPAAAESEGDEGANERDSDEPIADDDELPTLSDPQAAASGPVEQPQNIAGYIIGGIVALLVLAGGGVLFVRLRP